ncbi:MAG TPA: hypothetical protein VF101_04140 [Gaiellaceae bacterium]
MRLLWLLAGLSAVALVGCGGPDKEKYVRENLRLLDSFPVVPGARALRTESFGYKDNDTAGARTIGYGTTRTYRLPAGVSPREAVMFYRRALGESWRVDVSEAPSVSLRKGDAYLHVLGGRATVIVEIDYDCYKGGASPQCFGP